MLRPQSYTVKDQRTVNNHIGIVFSVDYFSVLRLTPEKVFSKAFENKKTVQLVNEQLPETRASHNIWRRKPQQ
jgi:hypothetical protein